MKTSLNPAVLQWVRLRADLSVTDLAQKLKLPEDAITQWEENGEIEEQMVPKLAEKTKTAFGYLFLDSPPEVKLPISDFRRVAGGQPLAPSRFLLSVIYRCQRRQQWYREHLIANGSHPLPFVGSKTTRDPVKVVAREIADATRIGYAYNREVSKWEETMSRSIEGIESAGIIVNKVGYADGYTHNTLSVQEFRGFALSDPYAPLIFVNGADAAAAQMFSLAHELVHIWLGESAVSNLDKTYPASSEVEKFCNEVAAEILVPTDALARDWNTKAPIGAEISRLARHYRVSKIVIARRGKDAGIVSPSYYSKIYKAQVEAGKNSGGNYYNTKSYEASRRFSTAIIRDTRNGNTMFREAMELLGIKGTSTFERYAQELQIPF